MGVFKKLLHERAKWNAAHILPFLSPGYSIFDFGCGDMSIALSLSQRLPLTVTGMDVVDYRWTEAKKFTFVPYTMPLPFADSEFDVALAVFVLHHIEKEHHEKVLRELYRISKRSLVIIEDVYENKLEYLLLCTNDFIGNKLESSKIPVPYAFRHESDWRSLFADILSMPEVNVEHFRARYGLWKARHVVFQIDI